MVSVVHRQHDAVIPYLQLVVVKDVLHLQFNQEEFTIKDADIFCKTERPLLDVNENINQLIAGFLLFQT